MIITLPWPDAILFPNRAYRDGAKYLRREAARTYRDGATWMAIQGARNVGVVRSVSIDFYPPNNRRDLDGMLSAIKPGLDGIFDGLKQNDNQISEIVMVKHRADKDDPRVVITIPEVE